MSPPPNLLLLVISRPTKLTQSSQLARLARTLTSSSTTRTTASPHPAPSSTSITSLPLAQNTRGYGFTHRGLSLLSGQTNRSVRFNSSSSSSSPPAPATKDDSHPHLYFHQVPLSSSSTTSTTNSNSKQHPTRIALSYLPTLPKSPTSRSIIGWLPNDPEAGVGEFVENVGFRDLMHSSIHRALRAGLAQSVEVEAVSRGSDGFMHISDERNLPPSGRIPEPEDIIGSVYVRDGKLLPETYEPQPMHRLLTQDGVTVLPYGIDDYVMGVLEKEE